MIRRRRTSNAIELLIYALEDFGRAIEFKIERLEQMPDGYCDTLYYKKPFFHDVCIRINQLEIPFFYNIINNNTEFYNKNEDTIVEFTNLLRKRMELCINSDRSLESSIAIFSSCAIDLHAYLKKLVNDSRYELKEEK